ncbi:MAG: FecR domain-containing protein [Deltaproteobacteria bacterium]|nr:FecR domain-containing protein [Deltaproteobacteria bacterium]
MKRPPLFEEIARDRLRSIASAPVAADQRANQEARRRKLIAGVRGTLRQESIRHFRVRGIRRGVVVALAFAAVLALLVGWSTIRRGDGAPAPATASAIAEWGTALLIHDGRSIRASAGDVLSVVVGDEVHADTTTQVRLSLAQGAVVVLRPRAEVRLVSARLGDAAVEVVTGSINVEVPKQAQGHRFVVLAPEVQVEVHGTRFMVDVLPGSAGIVPVTVVRVWEGRVTVDHDRRQVLLDAGASWATPRNEPTAVLPTTNAQGEAGGVASGAADPTRAQPTHAAPGPSAASSSVGNGRIQAPPPPSTTASGAPSASVASATAGQNPSTLSAEIRLFQQAIEARRQGRDEEAIRCLDLFLARHPGSTLAQEARIERFRALKRLGKDGAAAMEARKYLADHPEGFARDEARSIVLPPPAPSSSR